MVKVSLKDEDFQERKPYFEAGVHEVYIESAKLVKVENGSDYVEVSVLGEGDARENVRNYVSEKAAPYTLKKLAAIAVHNKQTEADKQKVRDAFKAITDTDQLDDKFLERFKDMQAWVLTEEDLNSPKDNGGYFLRSQLYGYEPKPRTTTIQQDIANAPKTDITLEELPF